MSAQKFELILLSIIHCCMVINCLMLKHVSLFSPYNTFVSHLFPKIRSLPVSLLLHLFYLEMFGLVCPFYAFLFFSVDTGNSFLMIVTKLCCFYCDVSEE